MLHVITPIEEASRFIASEIAGAREIDLRPLSAGRSGDKVYVFEIFGADDPTSDNPQTESGRYILKVAEADAEDQRSETSLHVEADNLLRERSLDIVPQLMLEKPFDHDGVRYTAMLLQVAGLNIENIGPASYRLDRRVPRILPRLCDDTLHSWSDSGVSQEKISLPDLLSQWISYRNDPERAERLHQHFKGVFGTSSVGRIGQHVLLNPLHLNDILEALEPQDIAYLTGFLHRDLHSDNVLIEHSKINPRYWIIDFGLSKRGPIGLDIAYFEISQILVNFRELTGSRLLDFLSDFEDGNPSAINQPEIEWLEAFLKTARQAQTEWLLENRMHWSEDLTKQFLLAKVAAGIIWTNKPLKPSERNLAAAYTCFYGTLFLKRYFPEEWAKIVDEKLTRIPEDERAPSLIDQDAWAQIWNLLGGFDQKNFRFILIAEPQREIQNLEALGAIPWNLVIDLDSASSEDGLQSSCQNAINSRRGLHTVTGERTRDLEFLGTTWLMANGWISRSIASLDLRSWYYDRLESIRDLIREFRKKAGEKPTLVVVMPGHSGDVADPHFRLQKCVEALDSVFQGRAKFLLLGEPNLDKGVSKDNQVHLGCSVSEFVYTLSETFVVAEQTGDPSLPSVDDTWVTISRDRLLVCQENLEVLHSQILAEESTNPVLDFWKGRPPNWHEIAAGVDIQRGIGDSIRFEIEKFFDLNISRTILVAAAPGSGATTTLRRIAWECRDRFPTIIVTDVSEQLVDRVTAIHSIAQRPLLIFAEASVLTETKREALFKDLVGRGVRFVLVYFRRTFSLPKQGTPSRNSAVFSEESQSGESIDSRSDQKIHFLPSEMPVEEAKYFQKKFSELTEDSRKIEELARITFDDSLSRYRSPFFYGLITFQRDFLKIDDYVAAHLPRLKRKSSKLFEYLALVTLFSYSGLSRLMVNGILELSDDSLLPLQVPLGEGPNALLIETNGYYRLSHQVIAEAVLERLNGKNWQVDLADIAKDFISDAVDILSSSSDFLVDLLREIFVDRATSTGFENEDRQDFSPLIERVSDFDPNFGIQIFKALTDRLPDEAHFWTHRGRYQLYKKPQDDLAQAELFVEEAVRLSPDDALHHHALGMIRRQRLRQIIRSSKSASAVELLDETIQAFEECIECFEKSRKLSPDNAHGYITHSQLILELAHHLKRRSSEASIASMTSSVATWIQTEMASLHSLLSEVSILYSESDEPDKFVTKCRADLQKLLGDVDEVVRTWEIFNASKSSTPFSRRALAFAYLDRKSGSWTRLSQIELERIATNAEQNIRSSQAVDSDYELWFEAKIRHSSFDVSEASTILTSWLHKSASWRPHYYRGCIGFVRWFIGETDEREFETDLQNAQGLYHGKRGLSFLWLGTSIHGFPLVSSSDLGVWDRKKEGFWGPEGQQRLLRVSGYISERMLRPQSGEINISRDVRAFFVPGREISAGEHENDAISFFLGISIEGLRAWKHDIKSVEGLKRAPVSETVSEPFLHNTQADVDTALPKKALKDESLARRIKEYSSEYVAATLEKQDQIWLREVEDAVCGAFTFTKPFEKTIDFSLGDYLKSRPGFSTRFEDGAGVLITRKAEHSVRADEIFGEVLWYREEKNGLLLDQFGEKRHFTFHNIHRRSRSEIEPGSVVTFLPSSYFDPKVNAERPAAKEVSVSSRPIPGTISIDDKMPEELTYLVEKEALDILESQRYENGLLASEVIEKIRFKFRGSGILEERLGITSFIQLFKQSTKIWVTFDGDEPLLSANDIVPFGAAHEPKKEPGAVETLDVHPKPDAMERARKLTFDFIEQKVKEAEVNGTILWLSILAKAVSDEFSHYVRDLDDNDIHSILGFDTFTKMLKSTGRYSTKKRGKGFLVQRHALKAKDVAAVSDNQGSHLDLKAFKNWLLSELDNRGGDGLHVGSVGALAKKKFHLDTKLAEALGKTRMSQVYELIPEVEVYGEGSDKYVQRKSN